MTNRTSRLGRKLSQLFRKTNFQKLIVFFLICIVYQKFSHAQSCIPCSLLSHQSASPVKTYTTDNEDWYHYNPNSSYSLVPGCNTHFSLNWPITNLMNCDWKYHVVLHLTGDMVPEISASDMFDDFVYTGAIPLTYDNSFSLGGVGTRKLVYDIIIPAGQTLPIGFTFDIIPNGNYVFPNDIMHTLFITPYANINFTDICDNNTSAEWSSSLAIPAAGAIIHGSANISDVASTLNVEDYGIILLNAANNNNPPTLTFDIPTIINPSGLLLAPGATIKIANSGYNELYGVNVFTCYQMANSIEVEPGSELTVYNSNLANFIYAINAKAGSKIDLSYNNFRKNFIGLNLKMLNNPFKVTINNLQGNTFDGNFPLKTNFNGSPETILNNVAFAGIRATSYIDLNIKEKNTFKNLSNGIVALNTSANINNQDFDLINGTYYPIKGTGIYMSSRGFHTAHIGDLSSSGANNFTRCNYAVFLDRMSGDVTNNTIDCPTGIYWKNSTLRSVGIRKNRIKSFFDGIISYHNEPLSPSLTSDISNNEIYHTGVFGDIINPQSGIKCLELFQSPKSLPFGGWKINNNEIDCDGQGVGILYRGGTTGSVINNTINNHKPMWFFGIWTQNSILSTIGGNTIGQELSTADLGGTAGILSQSGWSNTFQCNCIDNTLYGMNFMI